MHHWGAKSINCPSTNLSVFGGYSRTNTSRHLNNISYLLLSLWEEFGVHHTTGFKENSIALIFNRLWCFLCLIFNLPFWRLLACLYVIFVDPCLITSYDVFHEGQVIKIIESKVWQKKKTPKNRFCQHTNSQKALKLHYVVQYSGTNLKKKKCGDISSIKC